MAVDQFVQLGAVGHILEVELLTRAANGSTSARDVSGATLVEFWFHKPSGKTVKKTGALSGAGTDGKVRYTTVAGDLDESGEWEGQAKVTEGASPITPAAIFRFVVKENLY